MMQSKLELNGVVHKLFGTGLKEVITPASYWQMFKTYTTTTGQNDTTVLLKLIEIPANYRTSQEIIKKIKQQYRNLLHDVDFILVSRNFDHDLYLLKATQNLISVESLIQIQRQAGMKVDEQMIEKFLVFAASLENLPNAQRISFKLDEIGVTEDGKFLLANYAMYFTCDESKRDKTLNSDIKNAVLRLLMPDSDKFDLAEMYSYVEENYNSSIQSMVQKCMAGSEFRVSELVSTAVGQGENNLMDTTITDSFHSDPLMGEQIANMTSITGDLSQNLLNTSYKKQAKKIKYRAPILALLFIIILLAIGSVTFIYLKPRILDCQASQYFDHDLNQCIGCDPSCDTCASKQQGRCLSCRDSMYLVKRSRGAQFGKCSVSCVGTLVKNNVCIVNV